MSTFKQAREQTTTTRKAYVQATRLIGRAGPYMSLNLSALRDIVAATEDYDARSKVAIEITSVSVTEIRQSGWEERGRVGEGRGA